jgi:prepilin-type N-terminal cleavage/methylation domain-containing protein
VIVRRLGRKLRVYAPACDGGEIPSLWVQMGASPVTGKEHTREMNGMGSRKRHGPGQEGFTLIEVLIVIGIMGILAGVIIPNVSGFLGTGTLNAAKTEMANVKTAALAYCGQNDRWPSDSGDLVTLIDGTPKATYAFDNTTGFVIDAPSFTWSGITWSSPTGPPYSQDGKWTR